MRTCDFPTSPFVITESSAPLPHSAPASSRWCARRDVSAERQTGLRAGTALANAGLTWLTGSSAFLGRVGGSSGPR
jgi:hypothetical protein